MAKASERLMHTLPQRETKELQSHTRGRRFSMLNSSQRSKRPCVFLGVGNGGVSSKKRHFRSISNWKLSCAFDFRATTTVDFWVGFDERYDNWTDGSSSGFRNYQPNEPNLGSAYCTAIRGPSWQWKDISHTSNKYRLCQFPGEHSAITLNNHSTPVPSVQPHFFYFHSQSNADI